MAHANCITAYIAPFARFHFVSVSQRSTQTSSTLTRTPGITRHREGCHCDNNLRGAAIAISRRDCVVPIETNGGSQAAGCSGGVRAGRSRRRKGSSVELVAVGR